MREIKFRAFNKKEMKMCRVVSTDFDHFITIRFPEFEGLVGDFDDQMELEEFQPLMQSTGLKDKNGVEIFEGDILEYPDLDKGVYLFKEQPKRRSVMKWHEQDAAFKIPGTGFRINTERVEVIGNIYENPELLEVNE